DGRDEHPSLRITIGEDGTVLLACRAGCETEDVLEAVGLTYHDLYPRPGELPAPGLATAPCRATGEERLRHEVYSALLSELTLSPDDNYTLLKRGLKESQIQRYGYKTLKSDYRYSLAGLLYNRFGKELFNVPGFLPHGDSAAISSNARGILVPCR